MNLNGVAPDRTIELFKDEGTGTSWGGKTAQYLYLWDLADSAEVYEFLIPAAEASASFIEIIADIRSAPDQTADVRSHRHPGTTFMEAVNVDIQIVLDGNSGARPAKARILEILKSGNATVSAVPLPPAFGLFASALAGFAVFAGRRT